MHSCYWTSPNIREAAFGTQQGSLCPYLDQIELKTAKARSQINRKALNQQATHLESFVFLRYHSHRQKHELQKRQNHEAKEPRLYQQDHNHP
jgi:hypothetical protein